MLNINKVRKIVKAYQGLQIPDGPMTLSNGNFNQVQYNIPSSISSISINSIDNPNPYMNGNSKATQIGNMIGQGSDFISNLFSADKDGYYGKYGSLQQTGDQAFDQAANTVMTINPLVGGIMKAGGLVSDVLITYGGMGTDSMTKKDAILGSKLLSLTPVGMVNGFFGKKSNTFSVNSDVVSKVGGSYSGSVKDFYDSASKANKKYGLFSNKERKQANNQIAESKDQQNTMEEISSNATDDFSTLQMSDINHIKYGINQNGGIDFRYKRYVKDGGQLTRIKKLQLHKIGGQINQSINLETKQIEDIPVNDTPIVATEIVEYQEGGPIIEWKPNIVLEEYQEGGTIKSRSLEDLIQYAKQQNPRFIQRMSEPVRDIEFVDKE